MNDGCDLICKDKYFLLERLGGVCKLPNIAKEEDTFYDRALTVQRNALMFLDVLGLLVQTLADNFNSGGTKANLHKRSNSQYGRHEEITGKRNSGGGGGGGGGGKRGEALKSNNSQA